VEEAALFVAARKGNWPEAVLLIKNGVNLNCKTTVSLTILMYFSFRLFLSSHIFLPLNIMYSEW
jgi:hypothetical protein